MFVSGADGSYRNEEKNKYGGNTFKRVSAFKDSPYLTNYWWGFFYDLEQADFPLFEFFCVPDP